MHAVSRTANCVEVLRNQPNEEMKTKNSNSGGSAS
nr:MAG TPA: hypothetical protein [Caudoviricetes sp.]